MKIESFFSLLGGLALFLYGMQTMSTNLEAAARNRMKQILGRLTANRLLGVYVDAGITAVIQSSSATTVMVVGFVNSQLMTLKQAVWIIMGANIGTTITGQLIALDIGAITPSIAFVDVGLILFVKGKKVRSAGRIMAGLSILFLGMGIMSATMIPLRESEVFMRLMTELSSPFPGILAGTVFTAIIQSSSASVGIPQALVVSGLAGLDSTVFVLFGQNIGTCITAALISIDVNHDAKRTTLIHLVFNIIGAALFTAVCVIAPFTAWMAAFTLSNPATQIANIHTLFDIVTTPLLLPFGAQLTHISEKLLPDRPQQPADEEHWFEELLASEHVLGVSVIARKQLAEDVNQMLGLAVENVGKGLLAFDDKDTKELERITARGGEIDLFDARLSRRISKVFAIENSPSEVDALRRILAIIGNAERVSDHAASIAEYAQTMVERGLELTSQAHVELKEIRDTAMAAIHLIYSTSRLTPQNLLSQASALEGDIDNKTMLFRADRIERMGNRTCRAETSILYSEVLTGYEKVGDHALNITQACAKLGNGADTGPVRPIQAHGERDKT